MIFGNDDVFVNELVGLSFLKVINAKVEFLTGTLRFLTICEGALIGH